jgi:hypothetical protein
MIPMHPVMRPHPAMHFFGCLGHLYVMWHRPSPPVSEPFMRDAIAAAGHCSQRVGREPNPDNRPRNEREAA